MGGLEKNDEVANNVSGAWIYTLCVCVCVYIYMCVCVCVRGGIYCCLPEISHLLLLFYLLLFFQNKSLICYLARL